MQTTLRLILSLALFATLGAAQSVKIGLPDIVDAGTVQDVLIEGEPGDAFDAVVSNDDSRNNEVLSTVRIVLDDKGRATLTIEIPTDWKRIRIKTPDATASGLVLPAS